MLAYRVQTYQVGVILKLLMRAFSWRPTIPGTLKLDSILSLFKCELQYKKAVNPRLQILPRFLVLPPWLFAEWIPPKIAAWCAFIVVPSTSTGTLPFFIFKLNQKKWRINLTETQQVDFSSNLQSRTSGGPNYFHLWRSMYSQENIQHPPHTLG